MRVLFNLNGWEKEEKIPRHIVHKGCIEVALQPPINILIDDGARPVKNNSIKVLFVYYGKHKNGLPVFQVCR